MIVVEEKNASNDNAGSFKSSTSHMNLSTLLQRVKRVVETGVGSEWVSAELVDVKSSNGHLRLSLSEHDDAGKKLASCDGVIWSSRVSGIQEKFQKATGCPLSPNMKILVRVKPQFHPSFGFSLVVTDIDPVYTLGDIAKKLAEIRKKLKDQACYENQKKYLLPSDFTRVAVLSPSGAAGLGDFQRDAQTLNAHDLTHFDYYEANFQGENALKSIIVQLRTIFKLNKSNPYDCLVIIRGGGAVIDLNYLNEFDIAFAITQFTIPVFTGIGHKKDSTILDEVAHTSFDTPSKVILHIRGKVETNALNAEKHLKQIHHTTISKLKRTSETLHQRKLVIQSGPNNILNQAKSNIEIIFDKVRRQSVDQCQLVLNAIQEYHSELIKFSHSRIVEAKEDTQNSITRILIRSRSLTESASKKMIKNYQIITTKAIGIASIIETKVAASIHSDQISQLLSRHENRLKECMIRLSDRFRFHAKSIEESVNSLHRVIDVSSPKNTVKRGFSILRSRNGQIITDKKDALGHQQLRVEMRDGLLNVNLEEST